MSLREREICICQAKERYAYVRLRRDMHMLGSMDGKHRGVYVEYVSLMVSCYWIKVFIMYDSQTDNMVKVT